MSGSSDPPFFSSPATFRGGRSGSMYNKRRTERCVFLGDEERVGTGDTDLRSVNKAQTKKKASVQIAWSDCQERLCQREIL